MSDEEFEERVHEIEANMPDEYPPGFARYLAESELTGDKLPQRGSGSTDPEP
ncbi:hypothetical protein SEA_POKYPUPPY_52 [Gordonia phage PokyPuppy]|nr:hypothetical protein SEA_POKYPUPPY_52 [Gordonia phage PokyPuppy]